MNAPNRSFDSPLAELRRQNIGILGLGKEGQSTYRYLRSHLPRTPLQLADLKPPSPEFQVEIARDSLTTLCVGPGHLESLKRCKTIFKSPGISPLTPGVQELAKRGIEFTSNTRLFFELSPGSIIGVTGTKGKSTTTAVIHAILVAGGLQTTRGGNIGVPALSMLDDATEKTFFVMELSSYQLQDLPFSPLYAVLQNIVPEHLDYHGSFEAYFEAKCNLVRYQGPGDTVFFNADGELSARAARAALSRKVAFGFECVPESGPFIQEGWIFRRYQCENEPIMPVEEVPLPGRFNLLNVMPGIAIGRQLGIPAAVIREAVHRFHPLPHRLEYVGEINGVRCYDDSICTVPEAAIAALETFSDGSVALIAGGYDRGLDFGELANAILRKGVKGVALFSPTGDRILTELERKAGSSRPPCFRVETMAEALHCALQVVEPGDQVLLSPASASFGRWKDFEERGNDFRREVQRRVQSVGFQAVDGMNGSLAESHGISSDLPNGSDQSHA